MHLVDDKDLEPVPGGVGISSTLVCDAASNSRTSIERLSAISMHETHASASEVSQGTGLGWSDFRQLRALASKRAVVVLPTPRAPLKR